MPGEAPGDHHTDWSLTMTAIATRTDGRTTNAHLDDRDAAILAERAAAREQRQGPRPGDIVRFTDGVVRRFSHDHGPEVGIQTCEAGSFYLQPSGHLDFSGSLDPCVKYATLTLTEEAGEVGAWFFHHDWKRAHNAVAVVLPARVYTAAISSIAAQASHACRNCGSPVEQPGFVGDWKDARTGSAHCIAATNGKHRAY